MNLQQLMRIMPAAGNARAQLFLDPINAAMEEFEINTPARQAAFLAQIGHESGSLRYVREIADGSAYDNRADLGNTQPEAIEIAQRNNSTPGKFFKGRGLIQITGFDNYRACGRSLFNDETTLTNNPMMLERNDLAARSAAWFWWKHGLNHYADSGLFEGITRRINGGLNGYADRLAYFKRAQEALAVETTKGGGATATDTFQSSTTGETIMAPFIAAAIPALMSAAPSLIRLFGNSEQSERNAKAAEAVAEIAKQVTGEPTIEGASIKLQADQESADKFNDAIQSNWFELAEAGGGGIAGARKANDAYLRPDALAFWKTPAFWISLILISMVFMLLTDVFYVHPERYDGNLQTQVVTALLLIIGMVSSYWLGTSAGSQRKTELMGK